MNDSHVCFYSTSLGHHLTGGVCFGLHSSTAKAYGLSGWDWRGCVSMRGCGWARAKELLEKETIEEDEVARILKKATLPEEAKLY